MCGFNELSRLTTSHGVARSVRSWIMNSRQVHAEPAREQRAERQQQLFNSH